MKKSFLSLISVALVYVFSATVVSCSNYESPLTGQKVNDIVMEETEGFYDVTFGNADLSNIKAISSETWCTPTVSAKTIRVNAQANDTYEERKAVVTLTDSKDGATLTFNVIQKQNNEIITDQPIYYIVKEAGEFTVIVHSNVDFKVVIPYNCDWLKVKTENAGTRGLKNTPVTFVVTANTGEDHRYVYVNFNNYELGIGTDVKIHQLSDKPLP